MTSLELKNILIHQITEIDDIAFLKALKTIIDSKTDSLVLNLSQEQKEAIMAAKKEIANGEFITNEDLEKELQKWLQEK